MLFLISSAPDTKEFKTAYRNAREINAEICLIQNAVYAARDIQNDNCYILGDDLILRGITSGEIKGNIINYEQLIDLMDNAEKVVGIF